MKLILIDSSNTRPRGFLRGLHSQFTSHHSLGEQALTTGPPTPGPGQPESCGAAHLETCADMPDL